MTTATISLSLDNHHRHHDSDDLDDDDDMMAMSMMRGILHLIMMLTATQTEITGDAKVKK